MTAPKEITFKDVPMPELEFGQVLIEIMRIGICGSDIHVYFGKHPFTSYPVVQGHEVSGKIVGIGKGVKGLNVGDKVTVQPQVTCGICYQCTHGRYNICENLKVMGFHTTGMASEYFSIDAEKVLKLPDNISYDEGAMVEPLAVAVHAVQMDGSVKGKKILVLGAGPIGNLVAQAARANGAELVMIADISEYRLDMASKCGIDFCVNTRSDNLANRLVSNFGKYGADLIIECAGAGDTINYAINNARKGTSIIVVGVFSDKLTVDLSLLQDRELKLIGSLMYRKEDFEVAIELIKNGNVMLKPLISKHFSFKEYPIAYRFIEEKKQYAMKVIIDVREDVKNEII